MAQLTKEDFISGIEGFNKNIDFDRLLVGPCNKAFEIDLCNILPTDLLSAIQSLPDTPSDPENKPQTRAFFNTYFKPMWLHFAYARFLRTHGKNVTQFGIQKVVDQDSVPVSNEDVAFMINGVEGDAQFYLVKAKNYLKSISYILDGVSLSSNENDIPIKPKRKFRILGA